MSDLGEGLRFGPLQTAVAPETFYAALDPGIRFAVRVLHAAGVHTGQSCQGGEGHAYEWPSVDLAEGNATEGYAALHYLTQYGFKVLALSRRWTLGRDGLIDDQFWRIELREGATERADEVPGFTAGVVSTWRE